MSPTEFINSGMDSHDSWVLKGVYFLGVREDCRFPWVSNCSSCFGSKSWLQKDSSALEKYLS